MMILDQSRKTINNITLQRLELGVDAVGRLPSAMHVKMKKFNQAGVGYTIRVATTLWR